MSMSFGKAFVGSIVGAVAFGLLASASFAASVGVDAGAKAASGVEFARGDGSGGGKGNGGGGGLGNGGGGQKFKKAGKASSAKPVENEQIFDSAKPKKFKLQTKKAAPLEQDGAAAAGVEIEAASDAQAFVSPDPGSEGTVLTPEEAEAQGIDLTKVKGFKPGDDVEIRVIEVPSDVAAAEAPVEGEAFAADEAEFEPAPKKIYKPSYKKTYRSKANSENCH